MYSKIGLQKKISILFIFFHFLSKQSLTILETISKSILLFMLCIALTSGCGNGKNELALLEACSNGDPNQVSSILSAGVQIDCKDKSGNTPLMIAARSNHIEIVEILPDSGADTKIKNKENKSAILLAEENNLRSKLSRASFVLIQTALRWIVPSKRCIQS